MNAVVKPLEANLWDHVAFLAQGRKGASIQSSADILLIDSGLPSEALNRIGRCQLHPTFGLKRIEDALDHFRGKTPPVQFTFTVGPMSGQGTLNDTLKSAGLVKVADTLGMAAPMKTMGLPSNAVEGLNVERVSNKEGVADYAKLLAATWKPANTDVEKWYMDAAVAIVTPNASLKLYVGYANDKPVAITEAFYAHGVVGLTNIIADSSASGKGYAPGLMIAALRDAKRTGQTTAFIMATDPASKSIYERIGFKGVGVFSDFQPPPAAA